MTAIETTGSGLIAALEQTWADIRRHTPELPEAVVVTGTGLSSSAVHVDAKWGHFGADTGSKATHRTRPRRRVGSLGGPPAARAVRPGECLAEGPHQTLQTMLHEAVHALAHVRGVKDTSRVASTTTSASSSPSPASSAWPGQTANGRTR